MDAVVKSRSGSVLGKGSILKKYIFHEPKASSGIELQGVPNACKVSFTKCFNVIFTINYSAFICLSQN